MVQPTARRRAKPLFHRRLFAPGSRSGSFQCSFLVPFLYQTALPPPPPLLYSAYALTLALPPLLRSRVSGHAGAFFVRCRLTRSDVCSPLLFPYPLSFLS